MKVFNKFVYDTVKSPVNTNDIWFDGEVFKLFKNDKWQAFTLPVNAAERVNALLKDVSARIEENEVLISDLQDTKIDKEADDYYPQLSVGTADNLSGVDEVDSEFSFRRSGGGAIADGVARVQSIKGNSVVWNQKLKERWSGSYAIESDCLRVIGGAYSSAYQHLSSQAPLNHKVLITGLVKGGKGALQLEGGAQTIYFESNSEWYNVAEIFTISISNSVTFQVYKFTEDDVYVKNTCLYDLTQMFGAGNEPSTIEEFNARIPMGIDLYAYNEGEVIHMTAEGISSKGVNVWDEEWMNGYIYEGAVYENSATGIISKNHIRVLPDTQYSCTIGSAMSYATMSYYDKEKKYIGQQTLGNARTFKTPANCRYILFFVEGMPTYNHDICIGISGDWDGYHAPIEASEDLSIVAKYFPQGMKSTDTDSDAIRYNKVTNSWEKRVAIKSIKLKDLNWTYVSELGYFFSDSIDAQGSIDGINISCICAQYQPMKWIDFISNYMNAKQKAVALYTHPSGAVRVNICDTEFADVASFLASLTDDDVLYYSAKEPIVTEIKEKDFNLDYKVWNCGTEQMVASKPSSALSADITYGFNAVGLIKQLRSMIEALSAKVANL